MIFFSEDDFFCVALPFSLLLGPLPDHTTRAGYQLLLLLYGPGLVMKLKFLQKYAGKVFVSSLLVRYLMTS